MITVIPKSPYIKLAFIAFLTFIWCACSGEGAGPLPADIGIADAPLHDSGILDAADPTTDLPMLPDGIGPCASSTPALPDHIEACGVLHLPDFSFYLSAQQPKTTETIAIRLHTKLNDVQKVKLRYWDGSEHEETMSKAGSDDKGDVYLLELPATARPTYYRFVLIDGTATAQLNREGLTEQTPQAKDDFFVSPKLSAKTIRYRTNFAKPEIRVNSGTGYTSHPLVHAEGEMYSAEGLGQAGQPLLFYFHDGASGAEDHPPGGGDYYVEPDLGEAWVHKGTVFDVAPETLSLGPIDIHTHPYNKVNDQLVIDGKPMTTLLPAQGIVGALTMMPSSLTTQQSELDMFHQANRWVLPLVWVEPKSHSVAAVEPLLEGGLFRGLKFHPTISAYPADGALMDPFLKLAGKYRLPVSIHSATDDNATPARIVALAKRHPTVSIIMFHTELGAHNKSPAIGLIKDVPNIYAETSWTNHESVLEAFNALDSSRTIFGTDATVDGYDHFSKKSIPNPNGEYVYTIPQVMAELKKQAHPDAYANWAYLNAIRLYRWRFRPDADIHDTDGDGLTDVNDADDDNDGINDTSDPNPLDPSQP
jgi:predicted TIM-barrel fold metal-dependent hydrolase